MKTFNPPTPSSPIRMKSYASFNSNERSEEGRGEEAKKFIFCAALVITFAMANYDEHAVEVMLPRVQNYFALLDTDVASMKTLSMTANALALLSMWLLGGRLPRGVLLKLSVIGQVALRLAAFTAGSGGFQVFMFTRAAASFLSGLQSVLIPVYLAEFYQDAALNTATIVYNFTISITMILCTSVSAVFVSETLPWKIGLLPSPFICVIALLIIWCYQPISRRMDSSREGFLTSLKLFTIPSYTLILIAYGFCLFLLGCEQFWMSKIVFTAWTYVPGVFFNLPYPVVMTVDSMTSLAGTLVGTPLWLFFSRTMQNGSYCFEGKSFGKKAVIISLTISTISGTLMTALQVYVLDVSYVALALMYFVRNATGAGFLGFIQFIFLTITPRRSHTSAVSLANLASSIVTIPSAQVFGYVSEYFRDGSQLIEDHFFAYQKALILNVALLGATAFCNVLGVLCFDRDLKRAEAINNETGESDSDPLIPAEQEGLLEATLRSRAATMNSYRI